VSLEPTSSDTAIRLAEGFFVIGTPKMVLPSAAGYELSPFVTCRGRTGHLPLKLRRPGVVWGTPRDNEGSPLSTAEEIG